MGDGKALQMGTSHELGPELRKAFGIEFLDDGARSRPRGPRRGACRRAWSAGLIMGPRRRRRPARPAARSRRSRWSCWRCATRARSSPRAARSPTSCAPPACVQPRRPRRRVDGPSRHRLGAQGRAGARRDRAPRPRRGVGHARATHRRPSVGAQGRRWRSTARRRGDRGARTASSPSLLDEAPAAREAATVDVTTLDDAREAAATGWARIPGTRSAPRARPSWPPAVSPCAASPGPTARCPNPTTSPTWSPLSPGPTERTGGGTRRSAGPAPRVADAGQAGPRAATGGRSASSSTSRSGTASAASSSATATSVEIGSRNEKPLTRYFPELVEPLRPTFPSGACSTARS